MDEEDAIARGDTRQWNPPEYKLRFEEVDRLLDLLNQLSLTSNGHFICISEYRVRGFAKAICKAIPDWSTPPQDLSVGHSDFYDICPHLTERNHKGSL
jgi:hypothetical protein